MIRLRNYQLLIPAAVAVAVASMTMAGCTPSSMEQGAIARGDQAWARADLEEALAEYRLAVQAGDRSGGTLLRLSHAYAQLDRVDAAREA